jgi:hypothetical protein
MANPETGHFAILTDMGSYLHSAVSLCIVAGVSMSSCTGREEVVLVDCRLE